MTKKIQEVIIELVQIKGDLNLQIQEFSSGSHAEEFQKNFGDVFGSNALWNLSYSAHGTKVFANEENNDDGIDLALIVVLGAVAVFVAKLGFYVFKRKKNRQQLEKAIRDIENVSILLSDGELTLLPHAEELMKRLRKDYVAMGIVPKRSWF